MALIGDVKADLYIALLVVLGLLLLGAMAATPAGAPVRAQIEQLQGSIVLFYALCGLAGAAGLILFLKSLSGGLGGRDRV